MRSFVQHPLARLSLEEYRAQRNHLRSLLAVAETQEEKRIVRSALKDAKLMYERGVSGVDADAARAELARTARSRTDPPLGVLPPMAGA